METTTSASINYQIVKGNCNLRSMYDYMTDDADTFASHQPTFQHVRERYGYDMLVDWATTLLWELSTFCGSRERFGYDSCRQAAMLITSKYNIRLSEFLAFVALYKAGTFGDAKGFASGTTICNALDRYLLDVKPKRIARMESRNEPSRKEPSDGRVRGIAALREYIAETRADGGEPDAYLLYCAGEVEHAPSVLHRIG